MTSQTEKFKDTYLSESPPNPWTMKNIPKPKWLPWDKTQKTYNQNYMNGELIPWKSLLHQQTEIKGEDKTQHGFAFFAARMDNSQASVTKGYETKNWNDVKTKELPQKKSTLLKTTK